MENNLVKCRCGVWTNYGLLCMNCSGDLPEAVAEQQLLDDIDEEEEDEDD